MQLDLGEGSETPSSTMGARTETEQGTPPDQEIVGACVRYSDEARLFISDLHGYCLRYPAEYDVATYGTNEVMFFEHSILNASDPNLRIDVRPTDGMTVEQAADQVAEAYAMPGEEPPRVEMTLDGEKAIALLRLSGQDPNRQVVVVHQGYLYSLVFVEMDTNQPEIVNQAEKLYNTVIQSFNFHPEGNLCLDCLQDGGEASDQNPQNAMISGLLQHDLCQSGRDGEPQPVTTPPGCVKDDSPQGTYHADGELSLTEPVIEGVVIALGQGECPSTGFAEATTISSNRSFTFSGLPAGTYCVSINPQLEPNFSILRPGMWTFPYITEEIIQTTVNLAPGEVNSMVNFGWDYQFKP
ncbi:MAG: hypothetical protein JSV42_01795 [Chloroflexota bacterium]|nr:MAG: hypothetical protein JSV42_01795 [Chloroflexota bacterium]